MNTSRITVARIVDHMGLGGIQRSIASYLVRYDRERFRVVLVRIQDRPTWKQWAEQPEVAQSRLIPVRHTRDTSGLRALADFLKAENISIVHSHAPFTNAVARQAAMLAGTPVVFAHYHNTYENRLNSRLIAWERIQWPYTSRALMVSQAVQDAWRKLTGLGEERQSVVWVPINLDEIGKNSEQPTPALREAIASFRPDLPLFVSASRLFKQKHIEDIFTAVAALKQRDRDVRLFICGDGPERERLGKLAAERQIDDRVLFLGSIPDVPALLARSDGSILASDEEGFSQLNIEAMHCGAPVISTCVGVVPSIDPAGEFIYTVPNQSPQSIAEAIERVLGNPEERKSRTDRGRQEAQRFEATQWARNLEHLYEEELQTAWLKNNSPWGFGSRLSGIRMIHDRLRWRLTRRA